MFPLLLILSGGCSHVLISDFQMDFLSQENYGMSSRYAVQFQMGIIGIVLTAAIAWKLEAENRDESTGERKAIRQQRFWRFSLPE